MATRANPAGVAVLSGGDIADDGTSLFIVTNRVRTNIGTKLMDVTGDGDEQPVMQSNKMVYGTIALNGWMVATTGIGYAELDDDQTYDLTINYGSSDSAAWKVKIEKIATDHTHDGSAIGVSLLCRISNMTNTLVANIEA